MQIHGFDRFTEKELAGFVSRFMTAGLEATISSAVAAVPNLPEKHDVVLVEIRDICRPNDADGFVSLGAFIGDNDTMMAMPYEVKIYGNGTTVANIVNDIYWFCGIYA